MSGTAWWKSIDWFTHSLPKPSPLGPTGKIQEVSALWCSLMLYVRGSHVLLSFSSGCTKHTGFNLYYFKKKEEKKKKENLGILLQRAIFCLFWQGKSSDLPFTPFSLKNKDVSEICSYRGWKSLLKVGLKVKLVNLELS